MRVAALFPLLTSAAFGTALAQNPAAPTPPRPPATPPAVAASSFATTEVRLNGRWLEGRWFPISIEGPARIRISYGQPHMRGRRIVDSLVPYDSVWRFGANLATELQTDVDLSLGGTTIPRGVYTLFLLPSRTGWQLIVNKEVGEWGTDRKPSADLARIPLQVRTLNDPMESLSVYLIPTGGLMNNRNAPPAPPQGTLKIMWDKTELTTNWQAVIPK